MSEVEKLEVVEKGRRGRKRKEKVSEDNESSKEKYKYFVDLRDEQEELEIINKLLKEVNNKVYGREILFKDLAVFAVTKLNAKDLEKIQDLTLTRKERVQRLCDEHNEKHKTNLSYDDFVANKFGV